MMFNGKKVFVSQPFYTADRSIKERLFSWPWRPGKKLAFYTITVPNGELIIDHKNGVIYGHPVDIENFRKFIAEEER